MYLLTRSPRITYNLHPNRESLPLPFQMHLSEQPRTFSRVFVTFLESTLNLKHLKKKQLHSLSISEIIDSKRCSYLNA